MLQSMSLPDNPNAKMQLGMLQNFNKLNERAVHAIIHSSLTQFSWVIIYTVKY